MSKRIVEGNQPLSRKEGRSKNRIPDIEWLFGYGETKEIHKKGFLSKLMRKDWRKLITTTLIYILQSLPVFIMPLITSDVIDLLTYRPEGFITRIIINAAILFLVVAQNVPTTIWRSHIINKWMRSTSAEIKSGVIRKLSRLSITYHKEIEEGKIQSKFLRDIESVESYYRVFLVSFVPTLVGAILSTAIARD